MSRFSEFSILFSFPWNHLNFRYLFCNVLVVTTIYLSIHLFMDRNLFNFLRLFPMNTNNHFTRVNIHVTYTIEHPHFELLLSIYDPCKLIVGIHITCTVCTVLLGSSMIKDGAHVTMFKANYCNICTKIKIFVQITWKIQILERVKIQSKNKIHDQE